MNKIEQNIVERINTWKKALLDMTKRNRLLWYKPYRVGSLKLDKNIFDFEIDNVIDIINNLAFNNEVIEFIVDPEIDDEREQTEEEKKTKEKETDVIKDRTKAIYNISKKVKLENEEKGLNIGYIAVGFLKWYEREDASSEVKSPLIMIPIKIEQNGRHNPFKISLNNEEEITINPVIKKKLESDFNIELNINVQINEEETSINGILEFISAQIEKYNNWEIITEAVIDTFSFQNLAIWNDLDKNVELIENNPFSRVFAGSELKNEGFSFEEATPNLDNIKQEDNVNIYEVDSSQQEAIYRVRNGESFVIQGPPGTGKSQTITNIIAESLYSGKKVLFVSEKQAALNVVYHKLEKKNLSDFCLILHNSKQRKSDVREQIEKSIILSNDKKAVAESVMQKYKDFDEKKKSLNLYSFKLHEKIDDGTTPYFLIGELNRLWDIRNVAFSLPDSFNWNADYLTEINDVFMKVENYGNSFVDDTRHFYNNYWKFYDKDFNNSTRREVQEAIGDINSDNLDTKIGNISALINNHSGKDAIIYIKEYFNILNRIPFSQANYENISIQIENIVNGENKVKEIEKTIEELNSVIRDNKEELMVNFSQDFVNFNNADEYYKKFINKYNYFFSRFSKEYKQLALKIGAFAIKKPKYGMIVKALSLLLKINKDGNKVNKKKEELNSEKKFVEQNYNELNQMIYDKNEEVKELLCDLDFESLLEYQKYYSAKSVLLFEYKFQDFIDNIENQSTTFKASEIGDIFKKRFLTLSLERTVFDKKYANYFSQMHNQDINIFREYDKQLLDISAMRIKCKLIDSLPSNPGFSNSLRGGEMQLLQRELKKKSRLMPTRKLIEKLPVLLPQLKPCMMMSPLTVSSYFGTNPNWKFDIVIFDEASQVRPEYAITSIVRGSQVIVAGDSKQMPPTSFFDAAMDEEDYDEENSQIDNLESILDEMSSTFPDIYLNWHYRSKDESLIAFSNNNFYNNRLATFPSTSVNKQNVGINFVYCNNGLWESKNGNRPEAEEVALLVFNHIKEFPNHSLGVVAFGKSQEYAIEEAVNKLRDLHPELEEFFSDLKIEPFFIKNLENVQGDERDKIILSCGYGKDAKGTFAMRFGPLAMTGGERRLNVAITRAKRSMTVVSSFKANDIHGVEDNPQRKLIRDFIDYAERGIVALIGETDIEFANSNPEFDSGLEEDVYNFLINAGYKPRTQVGASGYKIDIAVKHPKIEKRYILAIECDGAYYHSSRTARDRDILRQNILENLGWKFHRIWSTDWLHDNQNSKTELINAIEKAISDYDNGTNDNINQQESVNATEIEIEDMGYNSTMELTAIYKMWNNSLKEKLGSGTFKRNGWSNNDGWNSLSVMESNNAIELILDQILKHKNGFCPEDVFREINEKVFEKTRYTDQAKRIYEFKFQRNFIDAKKVEIVDNTIRLI